ncbi:MAG: hypothetical protein AB7O98_01910 [Hyphomonadaceae bacterium]
MEWIFILGLAVWAWRQGARTDALQRRVDELERGVRPAAELEPLLLTQVVPPDEPLLLDTPLPEASNDDVLEPPPPDEAASGPLQRALWLALAPFALVLLLILLPPRLAPTPDVAALAGLAAGAAGLALAAWRRSAWLMAASAGALFVWAGASIITDRVTLGLAAIVTACAGAALCAQRGDDAARWVLVRAHGVSIATSLASVLLLAAWFVIAQAPASAVLSLTLTGLLLLALAAIAVRTRVAPPVLLGVTAALIVSGLIGYQQQRHMFAPLGDEHYWALLASAAALTAFVLGARPQREGAHMLALVGALGSALLVLLAAFSGENWHSFAAAAPLFSGSALLMAAAVLDRHALPADASKRIDLWAGAAAGLALIGVEAAFPASARTVGHACAALIFAVAWARSDWRILRHAALVAAVLAALQTLTPELAALAPDDAMPIFVLSALFLIAASRAASGHAPAYVARTLGGAAATVMVVSLPMALREAGDARAVLFALSAALLALALNARADGAIARTASAIAAPFAYVGRAIADGIETLVAPRAPGSPLPPMSGARRDRRRGRR